MNTPQATQIEEKPYGWVIVFVGTVSLTLGFGANVTVPVLIQPLEQEFGWLRAEISLAYTMAAMGLAVGGILWGGLSDRIGAKKIALFGAISMSLALMMLSRQSDLGGIYALYSVIGGLGFACMFTPLLALTGLWFNKRKGLALGIVTAGGAIGQGIVPHISGLMIASWGWRDAVFYLGVSYFIILVPLMFLLKTPPVLVGRPSHMGKLDENQWGLPHSTTLPWISIAGIFCCICMAAPIVHLVPLAVGIGFDQEIATSLLLALMISGMFGRIFFGLLADKKGSTFAYFIASLWQTAIVFLFVQTGSLVSLYVFAVLFGFGFSGVMTCLIICAREAAPIRLTGLAVSIVMAAGWVGMGTGGYQAGYFFDLTGNYVVSFGNAAIAGAINLTILGGLILYRRKRYLEVRLQSA